MKILITGGAGFIASNIADRYLELGHEVVIVDNMVSGKKENIPAKAKFYEMDICDDALKNVFEAEMPDIVNHHAAQMDVRKSVADPIYDANINVLGSINLLQNAVKYKVKKFIFASTGGAVYGEQDYFPADEKHVNQPLSPYGITKFTIEKYLYFYLQTHGLNHTIFRYANIYGPRQNPHGDAGVVAIFSQRMLKKEQCRINGDGKQTRDYVFVGDVVKANELALTGGDNEIFNIGTAIETDVNELFKEIASQMDYEVKEEHGPGMLGEQMRSVITSQKIYDQLGWKPTVKISDGLKQTVDFFRG